MLGVTSLIKSSLFTQGPLSPALLDFFLLHPARVTREQFFFLLSSSVYAPIHLRLVVSKTTKRLPFLDLVPQGVIFLGAFFLVSEGLSPPFFSHRESNGPFFLIVTVNFLSSFFFLTLLFLHGFVFCFPPPPPPVDSLKN